MTVRIMREYILTENERQAIKQYLKDEKATNLIYVLRHRAEKSLKQLRADSELLSKLVK